MTNSNNGFTNMKMTVNKNAAGNYVVKLTGTAPASWREKSYNLYDHDYEVYLVLATNNVKPNHGIIEYDAGTYYRELFAMNQDWIHYGYHRRSYKMLNQWISYANVRGGEAKIYQATKFCENSYDSSPNCSHPIYTVNVKVLSSNIPTSRGTAARNYNLNCEWEITDPQNKITGIYAFYVYDGNYSDGENDATPLWSKTPTDGTTWLNHAKNGCSYTTVKNPTCTAVGQKKCSVCGGTQNIPALGHSYSSAWTSDNSNHWHKCTRCSATSVVAAHPWTYSNVTASTHDKKCNTCGKAITKEAHSFVNNRCACGRYNQVTVSFNVNMPSGVINGPSPSAIAPITYTYGDKYLDGKYKVPTPSMLDHTFLGWYTAASGGTKIETSTAVTNVNAHTLYAHWAQQPMTVEDIYLDSIEVIEYAGISEEEYRRLYEPEEDVPYGTTKVTAKITGTVPAHYQYIWEYQGSHGVWKPATAPLFNPMKSEIEIPNASRDLNNTQVRLSIKNNYNKVIESNEIAITVYYRATSNTIDIENNG